MSFAVVLEGMTLIAYVVILAGGKQKRESGWGVLSGLHVLCAALQCAGMAIIVSDVSLWLFESQWRPKRRESLNKPYAALEADTYIFLFLDRPTSTTTTTASSPAGNSTPPGSSAPSAGPSHFFSPQG